MTEVGHNSELTEGERKALFFHHFKRVQAQVDICKKANEEKKRLRKVAKADGIILSDIDFAIRAIDLEDQSIIPDRLKREMEIANWLNMPVQFQPDLFADRAPAMERIKADGVTAGLESKNGESPHEKGTDEDKAWLEGWEEGQQVLRDNLKSAMEKKNAAKAEEEAGDTEPMPVAAE
ncbi:hypothetical protein [Hoeflea sp. TYP-13]|uniref:hypothetical protein n=1 Tax=Hoeflea sp. TYP-13 TaxID=3230023 RepID=UPI0034C699FA